jgi:hypothetical protein
MTLSCPKHPEPWQIECDFLVGMQTGQYSTQIFSLAVLLSSLFVYNQMGGIDEAALDRLSLVTEMTKHIRVRAGGAAGASTLNAPLATCCLRSAMCVCTECHRCASWTAVCCVAAGGLPAMDAVL